MAWLILEDASDKEPLNEDHKAHDGKTWFLMTRLISIVAVMIFSIRKKGLVGHPFFKVKIGKASTMTRSLNTSWIQDGIYKPGLVRLSPLVLHFVPWHRLWAQKVSLASWYTANVSYFNSILKHSHIQCKENERQVEYISLWRNSSPVIMKHTHTHTQNDDPVMHF